jgi:phosphoribosylglycinamide formyltransferase-1
MRKTSPFRMAVLVSGGGTNLQAIMDALNNGQIGQAEIAVVISNNANAYALTRADRAGIPAKVLSPKDFVDRAAFDRALKDLIDSFEVDLIVLAGCLMKIPEILIEAYPNRIINIHPALIPAFCGKGMYGLKPHQAALQRGVKVTGATVHFVNADLDAGPIILQKAVRVKEGDTPEILQRRVMEEAEWKIMPEAIRLIAEGRVRVDDQQIVHIEEDKRGEQR